MKKALRRLLFFAFLTCSTGMSVAFSNTATPMDTSTNTATQTHTATFTPTPTDTEISTITPTLTLTATASCTNTATPGWTITPIVTRTGTPLFTPTPTPTGSQSSTPTFTPSPTRTPTPSSTPTGRFEIILYESQVRADTSSEGCENWDVDEPTGTEIGDWTSRSVDVSCPGGSAQAQMSYEMEYDESNEVFGATVTGQIGASAAYEGSAQGYMRLVVRFVSLVGDVDFEYDISGYFAGINLAGHVRIESDSWEAPRVCNTYSRVDIQKMGVIESGNSAELAIIFSSRAVNSELEPHVCPSANGEVELCFTLRVKEEPVYHWTGGGQSIDWADGDNWDQDREPTAGADTVFDLPGVHTIYLNEGSAAYSAHIADGTVMFNGWELKLNNSSAGEYSLAIDGGAHLKWEDGELSTYNAGIGLETPGTMVFDASGTWNSRGPRLDIGVNSPGQLKVNGGTVTTPAGGSDTTVGIRSDARLSVTGEGSLTTESLVIGEQDGSFGQVSVTGDGAWLESRNTTGNRCVVGSQGLGQLYVDNDAVVEAGELCVGEDTYGIGVVIVENDADLTIASDDYREVAVGKEGKGSLTVQHGGTLSVMDVGTALTVAEGPSSVGIVTVGLFGELDTGHMTLGVEGAAEMTIDHGEASCTSAEVAPWDTASLEAEVWVKNEGQWHIDNDLTIGGNGMGASVFVATDGRIEAGSLLIDAFGILSLLLGGNPWVKAEQIVIRTNGNLLAMAGTLEGFVLINGGALYVSPSAVHRPKGSGAGIAAATDSDGLTIRGDLIQSATGTLVIEVGPSGAGILNVTGDVTLEGILDLRFVDGYAPVADDGLPLIACEGTLSAGFSEVWISGLQDGFEYSLNADSNGFELIALNDGESMAPGDMNGDGNLDYHDFFLFADHWQEQRNTTNLNGNLTRGDSAIDEEDLLILLHQLLR